MYIKIMMYKFKALYVPYDIHLARSDKNIEKIGCTRIIWMKIWFSFRLSNPTEGFQTLTLLV
jgi:hypothetical protein